LCGGGDIELLLNVEDVKFFGETGLDIACSFRDEVFFVYATGTTAI